MSFAIFHLLFISYSPPCVNDDGMDTAGATNNDDATEHMAQNPRATTTWQHNLRMMHTSGRRQLHTSMYRRRGRARDVTGSLPTAPPIGVWGARAPTRRDSRHTPSHARAGCGPGQLTTDPEEAERLSRIWDRTRGVGLGLRAPHFSRTPCQLLVLLVLSKIE